MLDLRPAGSPRELLASPALGFPAILGLSRRQRALRQELPQVQDRPSKATNMIGREGFLRESRVRERLGRTRVRLGPLCMGGCVGFSRQRVRTRIGAIRDK